MKTCPRCLGKKLMEYGYGVPRTRACNLCKGIGMVEDWVNEDPPLGLGIWGTAMADNFGIKVVSSAKPEEE